MFNFLRSFNLMWITSDSHQLCDIDRSCFFCNVRSSFLRLRKRREKGIKSIKLNEYVSQLFKYTSNLGWNWNENKGNLPLFIEKTIQLVMESECTITSKIMNPKDQYQKEVRANEENKNMIFKVDLDDDKVDEEVFTMKDLIQRALKGHNYAFEEEKCMMLHISRPCTVNIRESEEFQGFKISYKSHSLIYITDIA